MSGRPVPSQLDQVLPRFSVQKAGSYHSLGRIQIAPFGKGSLRILWESEYTFNFTRYGLLHGKVLNVSQDAIARGKPQGSDGRPRRMGRMHGVRK